MISYKDCRKAARLLFQTPLAWLLPQSAIPIAARYRFEKKRHTKPEKQTRMARHLHKVAEGTPIADDAEEIARRHFILRDEQRLYLLRQHRPGSWSPPSVLRGEEYLRDALAKGRGAILLTAEFIFRSPAMFQTLSEHGYRLSHLSSPTHGGSKSKFGIRFLNSILTTLEERHLTERVLLSPKRLPSSLRAAGAMLTLRHRLSEGAPVSIMLQPNNWGPVEVNLFAATTRFAHGSAGLAYESGAPLLPVFTIRRDDGIIETIVEPPLKISRDLSRKDAAEAALRRFVQRLQHRIRQHPDQWAGWWQLQPPPSG